MQIIDCDLTHSETILAILNDAIVHSTSIYDYKPRTLDMVHSWFNTKRMGNYPVIGVITESGELAGFASYGPFRNFPAYKYTIEHSLYVARQFRGQGIGKLLIQNIITRAQSQNYHVIAGAIDSNNVTSISLHEKHGFQRVAVMPQVGFKFGQWLDLLIYQLILKTPLHPIDG